MPELLDLKEEPMPEIAQELLALSVGNPTAEKINSWYQDYLRDDNRMLFGLRHKGSMVGAIGLEIFADEKGEILHIGILPKYRNSGLGRLMLFECVERCGLIVIEAETDKDAVDFYRRCGFKIESLGEKYPGIERFRCAWSARPAH